MFIQHAFGFFRSLSSGLIIAALLTARPTLAATWTWNGSQGNDHWTNTGNWTPASAVANNGTADIIFAGFTRLTPDMNANWNVNSVTFDSTADDVHSRLEHRLDPHRRRGRNYRQQHLVAPAHHSCDYAQCGADVDCRRE